MFSYPCPPLCGPLRVWLPLRGYQREAKGGAAAPPESRRSGIAKAERRRRTRAPSLPPTGVSAPLTPPGLGRALEVTDLFEVSIAAALHEVLVQPFASRWLCPAKQPKGVRGRVTSSRLSGGAA